ncbi:hypothetical protein FSP39_004670 [Pinctada imbricata]|uniref:Uncharacterized protein n=1 Tax=Pinctada imbricata TaxID=66713 RepID=A0AA88XP16_PINIB|nr:hypothetical protein FSP39_004670 [Pinctada imbricata]
MANKKKLAEDVVEYRLFPDFKKKPSQSDLEDYVDLFLAFVSPHLVEFIWQNEPFNLAPILQGDLPPHLYGRTNFGDNVEDEWFIVYLLSSLTKKFPGLVVKVNDNDEEFLLIEAADALPKWVTPETAENRVYLYNGELHIIPIPQTPAEITTLPTGTPSVEQAIQCVKNYNSATRASNKVQQEISARINEFPARASESIHHAHCYIPANLAAVLDKKPDLVSAGVRAFYYRDPIDLRSCRTMQYFRPGTRVVRRVKFTRCLYSQLLQQKFVPDKRCGYTLPSTHNPKYKAHDLGMKLAHGFEILCARCSANRNGHTNGHLSPTTDVRWQRFLSVLKDQGFFRGEMEGSKKHNELLENAKEFYRKQMNHSSHKSAGDDVLDLLQEVTYDIEAMRRAESELPPPDNDDWMNITPESLEEMLIKRSGVHVPKGQTKDTFDLSNMANSMRSFVDKVSAVDGAEFPGEEDEEIQFDSTGFISAMNKMFEFEDHNDSDSSSGMDEYGWDDSDIDVDDQPPVVQTERRKQSLKSSRDPSINDYMELMDRELSATKVGKSFEKESGSSATTTKPQESMKKPDTAKTQKSKSRNIDDEDDDFKPVDIDVNTVKNILESLNAQAGLAGPASNILLSMKGNLAKESEESGTTVRSESKPSSQIRRGSQPVPAPRNVQISQRRTSDPHTLPSAVKPTDLPVPPPRRRTTPKTLNTSVQRQISKESNI